MFPVSSHIDMNKMVLSKERLSSGVCTKSRILPHCIKETSMYTLKRDREKALNHSNKMAFAAHSHTHKKKMYLPIRIFIH